MTTTRAGDDIAVRAATSADRANVEALLIASGLPIDGVAAALSGFLVAESGGAIVGTVGMEYCGVYGLLRSTAVAPQWRSRGVARQLIERIVAEAEQRGVHALYLLTTTAETYFPSFGFTTTSRVAVPDEIQRTVEFQGACPATATVMCRTLDASHR